MSQICKVRTQKKWKVNFSKTSKLIHRRPWAVSRPQVKGVVSSVVTISPKKPNSANRQIAKVRLTNDLNVLTRMPGYDYFCVKYNRVLVHGGRANDVPGVSHTIIRGVYDFTSLLMKKKRRSIYGVRQPEGYSSHIRRKDRNIKL